MLIDWNAIGIMGTIAGSVGGTAFYLGRKIGSAVTQDDCDERRGNVCSKIDEVKEVVISQGQMIANIWGKLNGEGRVPKMGKVKH